MMRQAIEHHHQRFDGTGYPDGAKGEQIPLWARIIALADAYANMLTEQSIAAARTPDQALDELAKMSGTGFDGMLVRLLLRELKSERLLWLRVGRAASAQPRCVFSLRRARRLHSVTRRHVRKRKL
jgi:HD-GYP domain-containing protein (c-di-GMP phosphodiesterase class II)